MCCLSESSSACPCPAYVTFQERVTQWLLAILGNHCWGRCAQSEAHCITVSLKQRLPIPHQHFKKLFFSPSSWKPFLYHSLGVKSIPAVTPPRLIWPMFFPISQPKTQLKEILTNHGAKGVISSLNALPGLHPLCELQSFASPWEAGGKHIWCVCLVRRPSYYSRKYLDLLFLAIAPKYPLVGISAAITWSQFWKQTFFLFYNGRVHLCWEYSFYQTACRTIQ